MGVVLLISFENQASGTVLGIPEFMKAFGGLIDKNYVINSVSARCNYGRAFCNVSNFFTPNLVRGSLSQHVSRAIFGTLFGAQFADMFGRRFTFMVCIVLSFVAITLEFAAGQYSGVPRCQDHKTASRLVLWQVSAHYTLARSLR